MTLINSKTEGFEQGTSAAVSALSRTDLSLRDHEGVNENKVPSPDRRHQLHSQYHKSSTRSDTMYNAKLSMLRRAFRVQKEQLMMLGFEIYNSCRFCGWFCETVSKHPGLNGESARIING